MVNSVWPSDTMIMSGVLVNIGSANGLLQLDPREHQRVKFESHYIKFLKINKANLRDLIAATGLVISNWIPFVNFSARLTVKFDGWPCKTIGHLFYATSSFVHHFVPIGEFKLELQSGNAQFRSKSTIFWAVWPRNFMDDPQQGKSEGFDTCDRPSNLKLDSNRQFFHPCDREIWWMTLQNNRAPLLCYFKLCASFRSHWWIQTGVTVRKRPIWVKFDAF